MQKNTGQYNCAIVGATGAVGQTFLSLLTERKVCFKKLNLVASSRSAGKSVTHKNQNYTVRDINNFDFSDTDIVLFSAGTKVSKRYVKGIANSGPLVIDNTNAFRMDEDVPLIVPKVNGITSRSKCLSNIVANPNCTTIPMVRVLNQIDKYYNLTKIVVSTY